jgi:hypothetical protein
MSTTYQIISQSTYILSLLEITFGSNKRLFQTLCLVFEFPDSLVCSRELGLETFDFLFVLGEGHVQSLQTFFLQLHHRLFLIGVSLI